jgi:hypothetical protein
MRCHMLLSLTAKQLDMQKSKDAGASLLCQTGDGDLRWMVMMLLDIQMATALQRVSVAGSSQLSTCPPLSMGAASGLMPNATSALSAYQLPWAVADTCPACSAQQAGTLLFTRAQSSSMQAACSA